MDKRSGPTAVGGSSLLVIFSILCLVIFALLGVSTVQADGRLSQASADAVTAYYEADCRAEEIVARLRAGEIPEGVELNGEHFRFTCPVTDTQVLVVSGKISGTSYQILQWQTNSITQWEENEDLHIWDGIG